jgi:hypothetical protein
MLSFDKKTILSILCDIFSIVLIGLIPLFPGLRAEVNRASLGLWYVFGGVILVDLVILVMNIVQKIKKKT